MRSRLPIGEFDRKLQVQLFATFGLLMAVLAFVATPLTEFLKTHFAIFEVLKIYWPKFGRELAHLESIGSPRSEAYGIAQIIFPIVVLVAVPIQIWRTLTLAEFEADRGFVWTAAAIPFVGVVALFMSGFVFVGEMAASNSHIARALYQTQLFYVWIPLLYAALAKIWVQLSVLVWRAVMAKGGQ